VDGDKHNLDCTYEGTFLDIINTLANANVSKVIVAINKMDAMKWSETKFKNVVNFAESVIKSSGVDFNNIRYIPISGLSGENLTSPCNQCKWCKDCLLDIIVQESGGYRNVEGPLRMVINESTRQGNGSIVSGHILRGVIAERDNVIVGPMMESFVVKRMKKGNDMVDYAGAGDITELLVEGPDRSIGKYQVIGNPESLPVGVRKFDATVKLNTFDMSIRRGTLMQLYTWSGNSPCVFARIMFSGVRDVHVKPKKLSGKVEASVEIILQKPLVLEIGATGKNLGKFFLRCNKTTIGSGVVTEIKDN
ncbi:elongation factor-1alpha, putative, partial [Entamoeba invadens IP1]